MRYLHHRMQSCPEEQELLRRASALAAAREPDHPPPLPLHPLQVRTRSCHTAPFQAQIWVQSLDSSRHRKLAHEPTLSCVPPPLWHIGQLLVRLLRHMLPTAQHSSSQG